MLKKFWSRVIVPLLVAAVGILVGAEKRILEPIAQNIECRIHGCKEIWYVTRLAEGSHAIWEARWDIPKRDVEFLVIEKTVVMPPDKPLENPIKLTVAASQKSEQPYEIARETHEGLNCTYTGRIIPIRLNEEFASGTLTCNPIAGKPNPGKWDWYAHIRKVTATSSDDK